MTIFSHYCLTFEAKPAFQLSRLKITFTIMITEIIEVGILVLPFKAEMSFGLPIIFPTVIFFQKRYFSDQILISQVMNVISILVVWRGIHLFQFSLLPLDDAGYYYWMLFVIITERCLPLLPNVSNHFNVCWALFSNSSFDKLLLEVKYYHQPSGLHEIIFMLDRLLLNDFCHFYRELFSPLAQRCLS